jgi:hypothetical protein
MCRDLKARAAALLEEATWHDVYHLWPLRTARGATGWLFHFWGEPWRLYSSPDADEASELGELVKSFDTPLALGPSMAQQLRPDPADVSAALNGAAAGGVPQRKRSIRLW